MENNTDRIDEISKAIIRNADEELAKVLDVLDLRFEDLYYLIENLSNEEKDKVIYIVINKLLDNLKSRITKVFYRKIVMDVDKITSYYTSKKDDFDVVIEEGNKIAKDLLFKVIGHKGQQFDLPIDISFIKNYYLSSKIKKEQVYDVFMWIIIRYVAIDRCITWQEYLDDLKANTED